MLQLPTREQRAGCNQRVDDSLIGRAILARVLAFELNDLEAFEARRFLREATVFIDRERNALLPEVRDPDVEVVRAVPWRRVHEARTSIVGDVIACEKR